VEVASLLPRASLAVWKATLYDSAGRASHALARSPRELPTQLDPARWRRVFDDSGVYIFENTRALPRAWLVAEAEAVDGEEALQLLRGESARAFEPRRTALLEVRADELPRLPGGALAPGSTARIVNYEPSHLLIETDAPTATVLVVSEIFYPGWAATVDGARAPILLTDYLLRGVVLPAGRHQVEMHYAAPAARTGAIISVLTLCLLAALAVYARAARKR
jgi:hypothetical protein